MYNADEYCNNAIYANMRVACKQRRKNATSPVLKASLLAVPLGTGPYLAGAKHSQAKFYYIFRLLGFSGFFMSPHLRVTCFSLFQ